jgi:hypothetical protein
MFYNKEIEILQTTPGTIDDDGIYHAGEDSTLKTISCDVQPYSRDRLYRDYGFDEDVKFRVFSDIHTDIRNGVKVEYQGDEYKIVKVICWDDFLDWMINDE